VVPSPLETPLSPHLLEPDVRLALELAERHGQVTPRLFMAAASVSKATATRRLGEMSASGLLHKHGKGRSTCYTAAITSGATASKQHVPSVTLRLQRLHGIFAERFGVAEFVPIEPLPAPAVVHLRVRFVRQPDLKTFFALEQQLNAILGTTVDLVPADLNAKPNHFDTASGM
jgi:hypothetical protein